MKFTFKTETAMEVFSAVNLIESHHLSGILTTIVVLIGLAMGKNSKHHQAKDPSKPTPGEAGDVAIH